MATVRNRGRDLWIPHLRPKTLDVSVDTVCWLGIRSAARLGAARRICLHVEGLDHVPARGPVLIASRHFHHLYDALALLTTVPRQVHFFVALDWVHGRSGRRFMEGLCRAARWPVILRQEEIARQAREHPQGPAYRLDETSRYLRQGIAEATALLRAGRALVVFPEGYPNIDPRYTPKQGAEFLPFRPGFARMAALAARDGRAPVPVVPAGLSYSVAPGEAGRRDVPTPGGPAPGDLSDALWLRGRWQVTLRFGRPLDAGVARGGEGAGAPLAAFVRQVEREVQALSQPAMGGDVAALGDLAGQPAVLSG